MKKTKKITISAVTVALGTVIMSLGAVLEVFDLSACALASVFMMFIYMEIGSPYTWLVWVCTSLLTFVFFPGSLMWAEYFLAFGIYPILKAYIEKLPKLLWIPMKLIYVNAIVWLLILVSHILGFSLFGGGKLIINILLYLAVNVAFFLYDYFIVVMARFYFDKLRNKFKRFLN